MSVGLISVVNHELLKEIRSRHPNGIYSTEQFIQTVQPKATFYEVPAGEGWFGPIEGPHTLETIDTYKGESEELKDSKVYRIKEETFESFVGDLFNGGKACFLEKVDAEKYLKELHENEHKLFGEI